MNETKGKVAAILSDRTIAINRGTAEGVSVGDTAQLFRVAQIKDPDTGEVLGSVRMISATFTVNHVQEKLCTANTADLMPGQGGPALFPALQPREYKRVVDSSASGVSSSKGNSVVPVKVGQEVVVKFKGDDEPPF